jgi:predicted PurR-regulated permease PerM
VPAFHSDHKINKYFFLVIIVLFGIFLFFSLIQFFSAFLGAVMFYVLSKSGMEKLLKRKWKKSWAAIVIIILSFFIILLPLSIMGIMLYEKAKLFLAQPDIIVKMLSNFEKNINARYHVKIFSEKNIAAIQSFSTSAVTSILNQGLNFVAAITMMYFFLYFMLININRMEAAIVFFLPFKRTKIELFGRELVSQTYSNSVVVPMIAFIQGLLGFIAYLITGLPEAGFWAVITGFASIIPIVGTGLVWIPACIYLLFTGHTWQGIFVLVWGAAILGSADNVIRFLMARRMADTHPVITVLGVIIGLQYFGLPGLIFGPLLISYFVILLKIYYLEYQSTVPPVKRKKNIPVRFNLPFIGNPRPVKKK